MKKHLLLFVIMAFVALGTSCKKKEKSSEPAGPGTAELLKANSWHFYKIENYDAQGNVVSTTQVDEQFFFADNGKYYRGIPQNGGMMWLSGTYTLTGDELEMSNYMTVIIDEIDTEEMIWEPANSSQNQKYFLEVIKNQ